MRRGLCFAFGLGLLHASIACSDVTTELVPAALDTSPPDKPIDAATPARDATPGAVDASVHIPAMCGKRVCACDNAIDDDGDALIDGFDPECTGPFDDDESTFATGKMPGPAMGPACRGCFWDDKPGKGGDECHYASECLEGRAPPAPMMPAMAGPAACSCEVSDACKQQCLVRTPNGCDCFGCCEVTRDDGSRVQVLLNERCSLQQIDDKAACPACVPSPACRNDCGTCELCPGRTQDELPELCAAAEPGAQVPQNACDEGQQACGPDATCPEDYYCQLGCCLYVVP